MQAFGPGFSLARRSSTSRQGSSRFPGGITVCQPSGSLAILPSWRPNGPFIGGIPVESYNKEHEADIEIRQVKYLTDIFDKRFSSSRANFHVARATAW